MFIYNTSFTQSQEKTNGTIIPITAKSHLFFQQFSQSSTQDSYSFNPAAAQKLPLHYFASPIGKNLKADIDFNTPYRSRQRGLNEHTNGLVRQYLPKSIDFTTVTKERIQEIQDLLNHRPRKVLNLKTPYEVFIKWLPLKDFPTVALHY